MADILVVNRSALITEADIIPAIAAINLWLYEDVYPIWGSCATLHWGTAPAGAWQFTLQDTIDQPDDLGYHEDDQGDIFSLIDVKLCEQYQDDWRTCLAHEAGETVVDPRTTRMSGPYQVEICDPVEGQVYDKADVPMPNFVTPAYFNLTPGPRYDFMGLIAGTAPTRSPGGYLEYLDGDTWTMARGDRATGYMLNRPNGRRAWRKRDKSC